MILAGYVRGIQLQRRSKLLGGFRGLALPNQRQAGEEMCVLQIWVDSKSFAVFSQRFGVLFLIDESFPQQRVNVG